MLSVPRTRLSVRDVWSARRPSRTPSLLRLRSKSSQITNLGGAEVETREGIDQPTDFDRPLRVRCRSGSVARFIRDGVVWIVSGAWNRVGDQGYAPSSPSSSSPSLPLHGEEHVKGPRKKKEKDLTVKAKQWHGALCDTKFPIFFYYFFILFANFFFLSWTVQKKEFALALLACYPISNPAQLPPGYNLSLLLLFSQSTRCFFFPLFFTSALNM